MGGEGGAPKAHAPFYSHLVRGRYWEAACIYEQAGRSAGKGTDPEDGGEEEVATEKDVRHGDRRGGEVQTRVNKKTGMGKPAQCFLTPHPHDGAFLYACKPGQFGQGISLLVAMGVFYQ